MDACIQNNGQKDIVEIRRKYVVVIVWLVMAANSQFYRAVRVKCELMLTCLWLLNNLRAIVLERHIGSYVISWPTLQADGVTEPQRPI